MIEIFEWGDAELLNDGTCWGTGGDVLSYFERCNLLTPPVTLVLRDESI
jgi:hypothetical protein